MSQKEKHGSHGPCIGRRKPEARVRARIRARARVRVGARVGVGVRARG